jgi:hypothetical protein
MVVHARYFAGNSAGLVVAGMRPLARMLFTACRNSPKIAFVVVFHRPRGSE